MFVYFQVLLALLLPLCSCYCPSENFRCVSINGDQGNDSSLCLHGYFPCRTLNYAFEAPYYQNSWYAYTLSEGIHYLNTSIEITGRTRLAIVGNSSSYNDTVIQCTEEDGGLKFNRSSILAFEHFTLTNCSFNTRVNHLNSKWYGNRAALFFYECVCDSSNYFVINIRDIRISYSRNATALVLLDTGSQIAVTNSTFDHNGPVGRGVHVHTSPRFDLQPYHVLYQFVNCSIEDNAVIIESDLNNTESCVLLNRSGHTYSYGGGMSVALQNNKRTKIGLEITGTNFTENKARCGGGLFLAIEYQSVHNVIELTDCIFENNACPYYKSNLDNDLVTFGGGIRLEHLNTNLIPGKSIISIRNCQLRNNTAFSGGGLSISPLAHTDTLKDLLLIEIENTLFFNNTGNVGAAIQVSLVALRVQTKPPTFSISNSTFCSNNISVHGDFVYQNGVGAVYTNQVPITFVGSLLFFGNHGTALAAVGTYLVFNDCKANFTRNHGSRGGGIALLGAANMLVSNNTEMIFSYNHAALYGGAIYNAYIEQENLIAYFNCFVRPTKPFSLSLDQWTANFTFVSNSAAMTGSSIFTTSVYPCKVKNNNILCSLQWTYQQNDTLVNCSDEITTEAGLLKLKDRSIQTIPGKITNLNLNIEDDFHHDFRNMTVFAAHMIYNNEWNISVSPQFTYISDQKIAIDGISGSNSTLHLHTTGNREWHIHLPVTLLDCPPGFTLFKQTKHSHCICNHRNYTFLRTVECVQETFESYLLNGYWMGHLSGNDSDCHRKFEFVVSLCPPDFCNKGRDGVIAVTDKTSRNKICKNREGILCGKCIAKFGPAVNSDIASCVRCKDEEKAKHILIYIFAVYAPLLILFSLMIIFGVRLTTGPANAFIFYSQVISSNFNIDADGHISVNHALEKAYRLPYGLFNLEFVENLLSPFCISTQLNALDVFQLDYLVALTPLAMIVIVLVCFKLTSCCVRVTPTQVTVTAKSFWTRQKSGESLLHAFAAFVLLSYTKFGITSAYIIRTNSVYNATGDKVKPDLVYFAGQYNMADSVYLARYFFPACFVLVISALPPLFLLGYPVIWLEKCLVRFQRLWKHYPADKVHILLDTFQSCYKDDRRFFAGFYFMFRYAFNIVYITTFDWIQRFMIQQIACIVLVLLIALGWPYKKERRFLNYVDLLIFGNLAVINALSFYIYYRTHNCEIDNKYVPNTYFTVQYILVFLPLVYMILYCIWKIIGEKRRMHIKRFCRNLKNTIQKKELEDSDDNDNGIGQLDLSVSTGRVRDHGNRVRNPPTTSEVIVESSEYENAENGDETLIVRSRARNTYRASKRAERKTQRVNSCETMRRSSDSGISSSQAHHTDSQPRPSPLVPILSVEEGTKNYGATD